MTDQDDFTTIKIEKRFDDYGNPSCTGCPMEYTEYIDSLEGAPIPSLMCVFLFSMSNPRDKDCPIHNPQPDADPL